MVYADPFVRISWLFTISGTDEIAETTVAAQATDPVQFVADFQSDPTVGAAFVTHMLGLLTGHVRWADYSILSQVKVAAINNAGSYMSDPGVYNLPLPVQGTFPSIPPQNSVVMSLRSGINIGEATKGRMYLPHTTWPFDLGSYKGTAAAVGGASSDLFFFINEMNTTLDLVQTNSLLVINSKKGTGTVRGVSAGSSRVGDLVDTQRRRRNRIPETYYQD